MKRRLCVAAAVAALLAAGAAGQLLLARQRPGTSPVVGESVVAALGGLRTIAAEVVWFRADRLQDEGRFGELVQLTRLLTFLEPHEPEVWNYSAWNLAYNISVRMPREKDRWPWVHEAVRLLRDEGLRWNPHSAKICRELAFLFELKIGANYDTASPMYREEWRKVVEDVAARNAWAEIGMDPEEMRRLERLHGIDDWGNPQASAIYWATHGLATADEDDVRFLKETIRQSKVLYSKKPGAGPRKGPKGR